MKIETLEDAEEFFASNNFTVKTLKEVAKANHIYIKRNDVKAVIIDKLIEGTVGAYLKVKILKGEI